MADETNPSQSDAETEARYENSSVVDNTDLSVPPESSFKPVIEFGKRQVPGVPFGAELPYIGMPTVLFRDASGSKLGNDLRVKVRVPSKYLVPTTSGLKNELANLGGIIFPYTPTINYEVKADYSTANPMHSNFAINFYQRSSIGAISISGKFSVENENDAGVYIATMHLLKSLTRMRSGGVSTAGAGRGSSAYTDSDSGAPPPVCRLDAHGEMMLNNVPVVITSYRVELPDSVDYFTLPATSVYGATSVPTMSTIAITCLPMYSRNEMQRFSVTGYLNDNNWYKKQGFI
jgi:hypothetical protein